jgi:hypothetical protein
MTNTDTFPHYNIHQKIAKLGENARTAENLWNKNAVRPYTTAYRDGFKHFNQTIADAEKARQDKVDLAFMALSLCGGSLFTAAFAKAIKASIGNAALNVICKNNLKRVFDIAHYTANSEAAQFALGRLFVAGKDLAIKNAKDKINKTYKIEGNRMKDPSHLYDVMTAFTADAAASAAAFVSDSAKLTDPYKKAAAYQSIIGSDFFLAPTKNVYGDHQPLVDKIELSFYMKLILSKDQLVRLGQKAKPISVSVSDKRYPKTELVRAASSNQLLHSRGSGMPILKQEVQYGQLSQTVIDRINLLTKRMPSAGNTEFIKSLWLGENMDKSILQRSEGVLRKIGNSSDIYKQGGERARVVIDEKVRTAKYNVTL